MKAHVWMPQRSFANSPLVPRRLDQAYQLLLNWTRLPGPAPVIPNLDPYPQEVPNASSHLRPGLQPTPGAGPDHRTTVSPLT